MFTGDRAYLAERSDYLRQIAALQTKAARTEELEAENRKLNAELEEARQRHQESSNFGGHGSNSGLDRSSATSKAQTKTENLPVDIEEYHRVKEDLVKLESDYGKLVWARDHLEAKVREQKDSLRQWKEYRKNWILKHPNKRLVHLQPNPARASPPITAKDRRSTSALAPPAIPEGLTPCGISRSTSPHHSASAYPKDRDHRHGQASEHASRDQVLPSDDTSILRAGQAIVNASDSGDVTEGTPESEGQAKPFKVEPATGDSSPIMIFERSLKRSHSARGSAQNMKVLENDQRHLGATPRTLPTKAEDISSPISAPIVIRSDGPHDSLDLDEVGGRLDTPRKRQRMAQERLSSTIVRPSTTVQDEEDMLDTTTVARYPRQINSEGREIESERDEQASLSTENYRTLPEKIVEKEKKARRDERIARQHAHNDRVHRRLEAAERRDPIFDPPRSSSRDTNEPAHRPCTPKDPRDVRRQKSPLGSPVILHSRDVNAFVLPRTGDPSTNRKRPCPPSRRDRGAAYVPALAEDGEGTSSNCDPLKACKKSKEDQNNLRGPADRDKEPKAPPTHHRLGALLTKPSPEKSLLTSEEPVAGVSSDQTWSKTPVHQSVYQSRSKGPTTPRSLPAKRSELNHGPGHQSGLADFEPVDATMDRHSKSAQAVTKRTKRVPAFSNPPLGGNPETRPEHEPLRARPVHRLGLQDFKLNPAHSEYAYHESVRRHDEKNSLSGCTDRHCQRCKGLREHVTGSGYKTAQKPGESEDEADRRLLQDFLGDKRRQLRTMTPKERSDLLIEAKVWEFANRFGSHRQAFARPREAPGMWDVDFPTTQKDAEDRAAADLIEREKVQERYWEATRPKGKWIFADE